jgi:hypothetical protein
MGEGAQRNFQVLEAAFAEHGAFNDDLISMNRSLDGLTEQVSFFPGQPPTRRSGLCYGLADWGLRADHKYDSKIQHGASANAI